MPLDYAPPHEPPRPPTVATGHVDDDPQFSLDLSLPGKGGTQAQGTVYLRKITINVGEVETGGYVALEFYADQPAFAAALFRRLQDGRFDIQIKAPDGVEVRNPEHSIFLQRNTAAGENAQNLLDRVSDFLLRLPSSPAEPEQTGPAAKTPRRPAAADPIEWAVEELISLAEREIEIAPDQPRTEWLAELYRDVNLLLSREFSPGVEAVAKTIAFHTHTCLKREIPPDFEREARTILTRAQHI